MQLCNIFLCKRYAEDRLQRLARCSLAAVGASSIEVRPLRLRAVEHATHGGLVGHLKVMEQRSSWVHGSSMLDVHGYYDGCSYM